MELLRARSDDKKVIFRKLFHTEMYQKIVEELASRRKEKQQEMGQIRTVCQTEILIWKSQVLEPGEELEALKQRILTSDRFRLPIWRPPGRTGAPGGISDGAGAGGFPQV